MSSLSPTGAALPLCWSHAEYLALVRSRRDGICFDRVEPAYERYVAHPVQSLHEFWSFYHPIRRMSKGKTLRLLLGAAVMVWSANRWNDVHSTETVRNRVLEVWFADLSIPSCPKGSTIEFTFFWKDAQRWEGRNCVILFTAVSSPISATRLVEGPRSMKGSAHNARGGALR